MAGKLKLLAGLAAGYVLGARAGRERYEQIAETTRRLAERPEIRELTGKVRAGLATGLEKAAGTASDRLQQAGGEDRTPDDQDQDRAAAGGPASTRRPVQGTGQAPLAGAAPPAGENHDRTPSPRSEAGEANGSGREGGEASPEPDPSTGHRERSRRVR